MAYIKIENHNKRERTCIQCGEKIHRDTIHFVIFTYHRKSFLCRCCSHDLHYDMIEVQEKEKSVSEVSQYV